MLRGKTFAVLKLSYNFFWFLAETNIINISKEQATLYLLHTAYDISQQ